jgi:hypothetical protein
MIESYKMILRQYPNTEPKKLLQLNEAFFRLSGNQDFKTILSWLKLEKERLSDQNMRTEGVQVQWNQGTLQALSDILTYSDRDKASKVIEDLSK